MNFHTRCYLQTVSTASAGGGAVTRSYTNAATVWCNVEELQPKFQERAVLQRATVYRITFRKPLENTAGNTVTPTVDSRLVTRDETTARTFKIESVTGRDPRDREWIVLATETH